MNPRIWMRRGVMVVLVGCGIGLVVGYGKLRSYLHSDGFREFLSTKASRAAGVKGEFSPFHWQGWSVDTDQFQGVGDGAVQSIRAEGLHLGVGFGGVVRGVWELKDAEVRRLDAEILAVRNPEDKTTPEMDAPVTKKERPRRWYPSRVELQDIRIDEANIRATLQDGSIFSLEKISAEAQANGEGYSGKIHGGFLHLPDSFWPSIGIQNVEVSERDGVLMVNSAEATLWDDARLHASGQWERKSKRYSFKGEVNEIDLEKLVRENWKKRITGKASSSFLIQRDGNSKVARGTLRIHEGVLTALPVLEVLSRYVDTRKFREVNFTEATVNWSRSDGETRLDDIVLSGDGHLSIRGNLRIQGEELDGELWLGLEPKIASVIQGSELTLFSPGEDELLWTKVMIGGTVDHPKEDLTDRLIATAGLRVMDRLPGGDKVRKYAEKYLGDDPEEAVQKYEEAEKAVREARDVLKGIFRK